MSNDLFCVARAKKNGRSSPKLVNVFTFNNDAEINFFSLVVSCPNYNKKPMNIRKTRIFAQKQSQSNPFTLLFKSALIRPANGTNESLQLAPTEATNAQ